MNELINFLTSKEIIIVYIVAGLACILCFIIYLVEKNNAKLKRRSNTRELNKLVNEVQKELGEEEIVSSVSEQVEEPVIIEKTEVQDETVTSEEEPVTEKLEEELQYTTIEPDQVTAKLELQKLKEELERVKAEEEKIAAEKLEEEKAEEVITTYEDEQEANAIISLEELVRKSRELYISNEKTQYADDGDIPISLEELEQKTGKKKAEYTEQFIISDVAAIDDEVQEEIPVENVTTNKVILDDFNSIKVEPVEEVETKEFKFKSSPIISPIYGIENKETEAELELENTANYDKLDQEIRKTNEFLMTLRELQKKLE